MNCPYCGKEMEEGLIQSPQEISWIAGTKKTLLGRAKFHADSVILSELSMLNGSAVAAYLCRDCKKIVIDYADGKSDYNRR